MIHPLIPEQVEMAGILAELREGDTSNGLRLLRGATYKEALALGKSQEEALALALSPELARVKLVVEHR